MAYGEIELQSPTAKVTIGKQSYVMDVSQEVEDAFKKSKMTHAYGFIVLRGEGETTPKKPLITAFVPGDRENHDNKISAEKSVIFYNKLFVQEIAEYGGKKK